MLVWHIYLRWSMSDCCQTINLQLLSKLFNSFTNKLGPFVSLPSSNQNKKDQIENAFLLQLWVPQSFELRGLLDPFWVPPTCGSSDHCSGAFSLGMCWASLDSISRTLPGHPPNSWAKGQNLGHTGHHPSWASPWVWSRVKMGRALFLGRSLWLMPVSALS